VPGGGWLTRGETGAWAEVQRGRLPQALVDLHRGGATIASVCTGGMVLASAGLLEGRRATTHRLGVEELQVMGATHVEAWVVDEGDIVTAAGVVAGIDLGLWLIERFFGETIYRQVELEIEYTRREPIWTSRRAASSGNG
jgi:transcriptional regulator GlxA family with amidase domain